MIMDYRSGVIHQSLMKPRCYQMVNDFNLIVSSGKRFDDMSMSSDWDDIIDVALLSGDIIVIRYYKTRGGYLYCYLDNIIRGGFCCDWGVDTFISKGFVDTNVSLFMDITTCYNRDKVISSVLYYD